MSHMDLGTIFPGKLQPPPPHFAPKEANQRMAEAPEHEGAIIDEWESDGEVGPQLTQCMTRHFARLCADAGVTPA